MEGLVWALRFPRSYHPKSEQAPGPAEPGEAGDANLTGSLCGSYCYVSTVLYPVMTLRTCYHT